MHHQQLVDGVRRLVNMKADEIAACHSEPWFGDLDPGERADSLRLPALLRTAPGEWGVLERALASRVLLRIKSTREFKGPKLASGLSIDHSRLLACGHDPRRGESPMHEAHRRFMRYGRPFA